MSVRRNHGKAALPPSGYTRPASLDPTGLAVTVFGESGGVEGVFDFSVLSASLRLRQAFAAAFDRVSGPNGRWRAGLTCRNGYKAVREFLRYLAVGQEAAQTAAQITPAVWAAWQLSRPNNHTSRNHAVLLRQLMPEVKGLPDETAKVVDRRIAKATPPKEVAYTYQQFQDIRTSAAATFNTALLRIRTNREHLRRWYAGNFERGSGDWILGEALDSALRTGDVPLVRRSSGERQVRNVRTLGGRTSDKTWGRLFLTLEEVFALAVLLVASESWNGSVLNRMRIPEHDPAVGNEGFDIHMVEIYKRRRPVRLRYTSNNLVDTGAGSAGRLMSQAIEATELARQTLDLLGQPTDLLLVSRRVRTEDGVFCLGLPGSAASTQWARATSLTDPDGRPLTVSLRRIRRTVQVLVRKEPAQNSQDTHDSVYVLPDPAVRAEAQQTIAQGLSDALDHARAIVTMRMALGEDGDDLVELADNPELARAVANGDLDTATGACTDFFHSPFTEPDQPCTASFLWCLMCENAIATRRHVPRLVYLHQALDELRGTLSADVWDQDWRAHFLRLHVLLAEHTTPAERAAAVRAISDDDRHLIGRLLHRGLDA